MVLAAARVLRGPGRIWLLSVGFAALTAVLYAVVILDLHAAHEHAIPFLGIVALFAMAEVFVVHFEFRGDAQTFSLVEVPITLGLLYTRPSLVIPAQLLGAAVALTAYRKQPPIKLTFNLAAFALETSLALLVFRGLADGAGVIDPVATRTWIAAFAATAVASFVGNVAVFMAIALSGGAQTRAERLQSLGFGLGATVVTTSATLAIAVVAELNGAAAWLLVAPLAAIYLAHRTHVARRNEQRSLDFLHDSTSLLQASTDIGVAIEMLLQRARLAFQSDIAAVTYLPPGETDSVALVVLGPGDAHETQSGLARARWDTWSEVAGDTGGLFADAHGELIDGLTLPNGMIVPLQSDTIVIGYALVAARLGDVSRYTSGDLRLLRTIAEHLSLGLRTGVLENPALQQRIFERQLTYRANHDAITGLASEHRLLDAIGARLPEGSFEAATASLIVIDAGESGAQSLVIAERMRRCLRQDDLAARLDDGRYAVLTAAGADVAIAGQMGMRIRERLVSPIVVEGTRSVLSPTITVEVNRSGEEALTFFRRATAASATAPGASPPRNQRRPLGAG